MSLKEVILNNPNLIDRVESLYNGIWSDIKKTLLYGTKEMFSHIEIETTTECNRKCPICPVSSYPRPDGVMEEGLFKKIIDEVSGMNYRGSFSPHFYGEPLLDERMPDLIEYVREKLPKSQIIIWTNGDLLTRELFEKLIQNGANYFIITQHNGSGLKLMEGLNSKQRNKIVYRRLTDDSLLFNRGGLVEVKNAKRREKCYYPSNIVVVDYKGDVVLCCNDYFSKHTFGNLQDERLADIWKKEEYRTVREDIKNGVFNLEICRTCSGKLDD